MATVVDVATELDRRYANVRAGDGGARARRASSSPGSEYSGFEGAVTYLSGFQIVHRYAYVVVPADGEPFVVFPAEARYVGEHGTALIEQLFDPHPGAAIAAAREGRGLAADRRLRARLRDDRARLPRARGLRARAVRRRVRPRARGEERRRARERARLRAHQPARLRDLGRGVRARQDRGRGDGRRRGVLRRRGLRPADDEHGAHRARPLGRRAPGVQDRAQGGGPRRLRAAVARGRRPGDALGRGLARRRRRRARSCRTTRSAMAEAYDEYYEAARDGDARRARPATTCTWRSRRASTIAATTSATSPATRSG